MSSLLSLISITALLLGSQPARPILSFFGSYSTAFLTILIRKKRSRFSFIWFRTASQLSRCHLFVKRRIAFYCVHKTIHSYFNLPFSSVMRRILARTSLFAKILSTKLISSRLLDRQIVVILVGVSQRSQEIGENSCCLQQSHLCHLFCTAVRKTFLPYSRYIGKCALVLPSRHLHRLISHEMPRFTL